jgi:hypothetical protein
MCIFIENNARNREHKKQYVRLTDDTKTLSARNVTVALRGNNSYANSPNCYSRLNLFQNEVKRNLTE